MDLRTQVEGIVTKIIGAVEELAAGRGRPSRGGTGHTGAPTLRAGAERGA